MLRSVRQRQRQEEQKEAGRRGGRTAAVAVVGVELVGLAVRMMVVVGLTPAAAAVVWLLPWLLKRRLRRRMLVRLYPLTQGAAVTGRLRMIVAVPGAVALSPWPGPT